MILSLDISSSCTGYSIFDKNKNVDIGFIDLKKYNDLYEKGTEIKRRLFEIKEKFDIKIIVVEENLQAFRPGLSSAKTLLTLAQFNGLVRWICFTEFQIIPEVMNVNTARKANGIKIEKESKLSTKQQVLNWVSNDAPDIEWPFKTMKAGRNKGQVIQCDECFDMADSYVIGKAYVIVNK